jgi:phage terminase large subunit-like protein
VAVTSAPAWETYAHGTRGAFFAWWCETYLRQSIDEWSGLPLALEEWQRDFFDEALAVDEAEAPCWRSVALVVSRKNGKTALLAALALYELLEGDGSPEILLAASSDKQAGRLFDAVCAYARMAPELLDRLVIRA